MDNKPTYNQYDWNEIKAYLQGSSTAQQRHLLEKQALQDPFLADALEGLGNTQTNMAVSDIANINTTILSQPQQAKVVAMAPKTKKINWLYVGSAAAIFILAVFGVYRLNTNNPKTTIAVVTNNQATINEPSINTAADSIVKKNDVATTSNNKNLKGKQNEVIFNATTSTKASTENSTNEVNNFNASPPVETKTSDAKQITSTQTANATLNTDVATQKENASEEAANNTQGLIAKQENNSRQSNTGAVDLNRSNNLFSNNNIIRGRAITPQGDPVAYASVQVPNTRFVTQTDKFGNFSVPTQSITDTVVPIQINSVGYDAANAVANNNSRNYVVLNPSNNALNEVVVTNVGTNRKTKALIAKPIDIGMDTILSPVGGWPAFENYLNSLGYKNSLYDSTFGNGRNTKIGVPPHQEVVIEFKADKKGNPTDIQVIQTPSQETASKAVDALKKGPKWTSRSKKAKAKVAIKL